MVADEADVRCTETVQLIAHPLEFARQAEVGLIAAVYDKVHAVAAVYGGDLDLFDVTAVDVAFAVETRVVGVILDDVAPDGQPHDSGCGDEGCP